MTESVSLKPDLGRYGVWTFGAPEPEQATEIEKLGYGAIWVGGSPAGDLSFVEPLLEATETLQVATGIVNVWTAKAAEVADVEAPVPGQGAAHEAVLTAPRARRGRRTGRRAGSGAGTGRPG